MGVILGFAFAYLLPITALIVVLFWWWRLGLFLAAIVGAIALFGYIVTYYVPLDTAIGAILVVGFAFGLGRALYKDRAEEREWQRQLRESGSAVGPSPTQN